MAKVRVLRAMTGQEVCELVVNEGMTVMELKGCIRSSSGIPEWEQRLLLGTSELQEAGQLVSAALEGKTEAELTLMTVQNREAAAANRVICKWRSFVRKPASPAAEAGAAAGGTECNGSLS
mmetsp:Transcript_36277/g.49497  ORF Transcript_36277/g.49497 Transcript_36277/m.49497 type:complete len:121 (+) Transcript_36277:52-414(+)